MIKRIFTLFLVLIVGLLLLRWVILPAVVTALGIPTLASWTGLEGFLKFLPLGILVTLAVAVIWGIYRSGKED
ncbi:MAG: hypothetical protein MUO97_02735 [Dehalococcoidia bacterium]|nr:hypothetical protein [Dehalococcoidia bacterium]